MKTQGKVKSKKFSQVSCKKSSCKVKHVLCTWLECKESWQIVTVGFHKCFMGKAFPWDTHKALCFANFSYLILQVSTHTIYTHITHILRGVLFREKTLATILERERLLYPQLSTQSIVVFLNSYISISKSLRGWWPKHLPHPFWMSSEVLVLLGSIERSQVLADAIGCIVVFGELNKTQFQEALLE